MTSAASFGLATTAGNYVLTFGGSIIGNWVEDWNTRAQRTKDPSPRLCFWSSVVAFDGYYPQVLWDHHFVVYLEAANRNAYMQAFLEMSQFYSGDERALKIQQGDDGATILASLGDCLMRGALRPENPNEMIRHAAGFVGIDFVGKVRPTVTTSPLV